MKKIDKLLEYFVYLLVFVLPWQSRWIIKSGEINGGYWEYGTISLYIFDFVLLAGLLLFIWAEKKKIGKNQNLWLFVIFGTVVLLSALWADNWQLSLFYFIRVAFAIGFYIILSKAMFNRVHMIYAFLASACAHASLGIWQFLSQTTFSSN